MKLTDLPLDRPIATVMLLISLTVLGTVAINFLPLGFMPLVAEPEIDVQVNFPGSHPMEGLREVLKPIEEEVATIPDVKRVFGWSNSGNVGLEAQFDWGINPDLKMLEVREAVERVRPSLPEGIEQITVEGDTDGPGAQILQGRISAKMDLSQSWDLLDQRIRRPLERVRGVASVFLDGVDPLEVRIDLDLAALRQHGLDAGQLIQRINQANYDMDLGAVHGSALRYDVRTEARFRDIETVRDLVISDNGLRLHDVAEVALREPPLKRGRHLNRDFAIGFDINKEASANTVATVSRLMEKIDEIGNDPALGGVAVVVWENQGEEILNSLAGLRNAGIFGGLMAVTVLFLFLRRLRTTLIVAVAIPFSLLVTCGMMFLLGMELNVLTMLGLMLGVGMLVDNAVVVIENIYRLQAKGASPAEAARLGPRQVGLAVLAATATTLIVWSWLLIIEPNQIKIYIGAVAGVICMSVVCSLLISLTFIPLAAARFSSPEPIRPGFFVKRLLPRYRAVLGWTLRHRLITLLLLFLVGASAAIPFSQIEKSGEPREQPSDLVLDYRVADATTVENLEGYVNVVEDWLESRRDELGYSNLYSWFSEDDNFANTRLYLPEGQNTEANFKALEKKVMEGLPTIPGVQFALGNQRGRNRGPSKGGAVRVSVHGEDPEYLQEIALEIESKLFDLPHVNEVYGPTLNGRAEARVEVDVEKARSLGLEPRAVADTVAFVFRGQRLRRYHGPQGEIDMTIALPEEAQPGLGALESLPINLGEDNWVPLNAVADVVIGSTPRGIDRVDRKTTVRITTLFDDDELTTEEMRENIETALAGLSLPEGYAWDWGTQHRDGDEALGVMFMGIQISIVIVLLLMIALFESISQPLAILITLPLALFGSFWTLWLAGFVLEILAFIGIIILIGVVVNNGIVMVDHVNALRRSGMGRQEALIEGCGDRLRPVLMTVITTVVGLIPLAMSEFTVAGIYIQSMAVAMIGGLISSTLFTLVALPVWYSAVEDFFALLRSLLPWSLFGKAGGGRRSVLAD